MTAALSMDLNATSLMALLGAIGTLVMALRSVLIVGPERGRTVEETAGAMTQRATSALELALTRVEADNARWRGEVDQLEARMDEALERLRAVTAERDRLAGRVERMLARFSQAGIDPPA